MSFESETKSFIKIFMAVCVLIIFITILIVARNSEEEDKSVKECEGQIYRHPYHINLELNICTWNRSYVSCKEIFNLPKNADLKHCYKLAQ